MRQVEQSLAVAHYREALELCERIQLAEGLPRKFWFCKGRALEGLAEKRRAIEAYRCEIAAVKRVPPDLLGQIGVLLMELGDYAGAAKCLTESCNISLSTERLILLGSALFHLGRGIEARKMLETALDIDPLNDEAWNNLGAYLLDAPAEAEQAFRRALAINPTRSNSYGGLARVYLGQGKIQNAIDLARRGLEANPHEGVCYAVIGNGMEALGNLDESEAAFLSAFRCDHDKPAAILGIARILERKGRTDDARDWYQRGLRGWPDETRISNAYGLFVDRVKNSEDVP